MEQETYEKLILAKIVDINNKILESQDMLDEAIQMIDELFAHQLKD